MNYFIEGIQGAGKSTLTGALAQKLPEYHVYREGDYNPVELAWCAYLDGERYGKILEKYAQIADEIRSHTVTEQKENGKRYVVSYTQILTDIPGFHKDLEQYEIYNGRTERNVFEDTVLSRYSAWNGENSIFECSILQNIIEDQILFREMSDEEIIDFYRRLKTVIDEKPYKILYLEPDDIAGTIDVIRRERVDEKGNEIWFRLMTEYLENSPYGIRHGLRGFDGLVTHLKHRLALEKTILHIVFPDNCVILKSKNYNLADI